MSAAVIVIGIIAFLLGIAIGSIIGKNTSRNHKKDTTTEPEVSTDVKEVESTQP